MCSNAYNLSQAALQAHLNGTTMLEAGRHGDGRGLYLLVSKTGAASWVFMWTVAGKRSEMGLGSFTGQGRTSRLSLKDARLKADGVRLALSRDIDPLAEKKAAKLAAKQAAKAEAATLQVILDAFLKTEPGIQGWKPEADGSYAQAKVWRNSLSRHCAKLLVMPVDTITVQDVIDALAPIWFEITKTAEDIRNRLEQLFQYAADHDHRVGMTNPAAWAGKLKGQLRARPSKAKAKSHPALPIAELPAFMERIGAARGFAAKALEFCVLTATRTSEAREARWSEIDLEAGVWVIPAERMKAGKEHKVRLSSQALDLLRSLDRVVGNDCLFPGQEPGASVGETALRDKLNKGKAKGGLGYSAEHATVHGFRSTFRDWAGDNLVGFTDQDIEFCLAHVVGDAAEAAYRRADSFVKRGLIMQAWADYATGVKKAATLQLVEAA